MRAVIPVAGFGSRLRPHTHSLPKVLLHVAGKPIIAHILDELKLQNINKITIIYGYKGDMIRDYIDKTYDFDVEYVEQKELLGLGHAIWCAKDTFNGEDLLMILGDTIFDADLSKAWEQGKSSIGVKEIEDPRRFGVVVETENGLIDYMVEKPQEFVSNKAIVGIYYIKNSNLLGEQLQKLIDEEIKTRGEYQLTDSLQMMLESGEQMVAFPVSGWLDCGKKETMLQTNRFLLKKNDNKYEGSDPRLDNSKIIYPCFIGEDVKIVNSTIGPNVSLANGVELFNCNIKNSIIAKDSKLINIKIEDSLVGERCEIEAKYETELRDLNIGSDSEINLYEYINKFLE
jgi:glucose-1-phosphate thymidylyltransferase